MCKCVTAGRPWIPIRILHGAYVGAQRACSEGGMARWIRKMVLSRTAGMCVTYNQQYFIGNMYKCVHNVNMSLEIQAMSYGT